MSATQSEAEDYSEAEEEVSRLEQRPALMPRHGMDALEHLYAPSTANITLEVGKYEFRCHREYLSRCRFFEALDLQKDHLSINIPVPSKFMDCLTYIYIGRQAVLEFHQGMFIPSVFLDTYRNAIFLQLDELLQECYQRWVSIPCGGLH